MRGIYLIHNTINDKCYVGSSIRLTQRITKHFNDLKKGIHYNKKLQNHVNKYGIETIMSCILFSDKEIEESKLRQLEEEHITLYNSVEKGFNILSKTINVTIDPDSRKVISEKSKLRQSCPKYRKKLSDKYRGTNSITSKLSKEDIKYIKENAVKSKVRYKNILELAIKFGVNRKTIWRVLHNKTYKND